MAAPKLDNDQRMIVLRMHAEGHGVITIQKHVQDNFKIRLNHQALTDTCASKKWQPYIKNFREDYLSKVKAVPIANKRIRIDDLERERQRLNKLIESSPTNTKTEKGTYISLVGELRKIIVEAREEMEKKPHLFQNVVVGMGDMSDEGLHRRKQELITKIRRADGRGALGVESDSGGVGQEDL